MIVDDHLEGLRFLRPDIEEVVARWDAFWLREGSRPMVWATCLRENPDTPGKIRELAPRYPIRPDWDFEKISQDLVELMSTCFDYVGDEVPSFSPSFGPDQFAAFLGAEIHYPPDNTETSWSNPLGRELEDILPIAVDEGSPFLKAMDRLVAQLAEKAKGRFVVSAIDLHGNLDALAALRGPENTCIDMMEKPELAKRALCDITEVFKSVYLRHYELGRMEATGTCSWLPTYSSKKYQGIASDFICLLSPKLAREFVLPALEEEASVLDHVIFHLDGPMAMPHLDDILSMEKLHAVQWVPGDGHPQHGPYWFDLYKRVLRAGKGLWITCEPEMVRIIHGELRSPHVIYHISGTRVEIESLLGWLGQG